MKMEHKPNSAACLICKKVSPSYIAHAWDSEYSSTNLKYPYFLCTECDVIFIKDPPKDILPIIYPKNYYSYEQSTGTGWLENIKQKLDVMLFKKLIQRTRHTAAAVLDIGGGNGWLLDSIKKHVPSVGHTCVVDIDTNALDIAKRKGHEAVHAELSQFATDRKYDLIIMMNIIEHVADPMGSLMNVKTV
jgi:SAM-dependent methyltransferase